MVDLGLQQAGYKFAASHDEDPQLYILAYNFGPFFGIDFLQLPVDIQVPLLSQIFEGDFYPRPFPWLLPVEPDH